MLSLSHEILVDLFRQRPTLGVELLRACTTIRLPRATARLASIDLTQVVPAAYRADSIIVLHNRRRRPVAAVIIEVQLGFDRHKRMSWPVYVAAARANLGCPVTLLVLAPDRAVARWARRPIDLGHPGYVLQPLVIGFQKIPRITDVTQARAAPELAVLSALAHPDAPAARTALVALDGLPEDRQTLYWDVIIAGLPALVRQALEASMKGYEYQSDFARKYYSQGREEGQREGRQEGQREGRQEGQREGREEGLRRAIVELVCARLPGIRDELATRLRGQPEPLLAQIAVELGKATDEDGVRAALDHVLGPRS